jgi:4-amino-4-deoxy-L-arabinose transferase-like glycosyltransferase
VAVAVLAAWPIWASLPGQPLVSGTEGRYAVAARTMATGGTWLVPELHGEPHLTKPPLAYWAQAASMKLLGPTDFAAQVPSAVAGTLTLLLVLALGARLGGLRLGVLAVAVLSVTPVHLHCARLITTDALLGLCMFAVLATSLLCVMEPQRRRWPVALWASIALGMLVKGPLVLLALLVVIVWLLVGGRWRELKRLRPLVGAPLSLLPIAAWALLVARRHPEAWDLWYGETIGRAVGTGGRHHEPFWFYVTVAPVVLLPATIVMRYPFIHVRASALWRALRRGRPVCLWLVALVVPLVVFSLNSGKIERYLLPLAPPAAILAALGIARHWRIARPWPPAWTGPVCLVAALAMPIAAGIVVLRAGGAGAWGLGPLAVAVVGLGVLVRAASRSARPVSAMTHRLAAVWLTVIIGWNSMAAGRVALSTTRGSSAVTSVIEAAVGDARPTVVLLGFTEETLAFYQEGTFHLVRQADDLADLAATTAGAFVVISDIGDWEDIESGHPELAAAFERVMLWERRPIRTNRLVLRRVTSPAEGP